MPRKRRTFSSQLKILRWQSQIIGWVLVERQWAASRSQSAFLRIPSSIGCVGASQGRKIGYIASRLDSRRLVFFPFHWALTCFGQQTPRADGFAAAGRSGRGSPATPECSRWAGTGLRHRPSVARIPIRVAPQLRSSPRSSVRGTPLLDQPPVLEDLGNHRGARARNAVPLPAGHRDARQQKAGTDDFQAIIVDHDVDRATGNRGVPVVKGIHQGFPQRACSCFIAFSISWQIVTYASSRLASSIPARLQPLTNMWNTQVKATHEKTDPHAEKRTPYLPKLWTKPRKQRLGFRARAPSTTPRQSPISHRNNHHKTTTIATPMSVPQPTTFLGLGGCSARSSSRSEITIAVGMSSPAAMPTCGVPGRIAAGGAPRRGSRR